MKPASVTMQSNVLKNGKRLCIFRGLCALVLSIIAQFVLFVAFLYLVNYSFLHPIQWILDSISLTFSIYTWFSTIPLLCTVVIYGISLGKSLLSIKTYYATRLRWFFYTAPQKSLSLAVHILLGIVTAWLYARYLHTDYSNLTFECIDTKICLNSRYFFLILTGAAAGCYYFVREHLRVEPTVEFPIVQQTVLAHLRLMVGPTIYEAVLKSFVPTLCCTVSYWLLGSHISRRFAFIIDVEYDVSLDTFVSIVLNVRLIFYAWILFSHILINMYLMKECFSIMLSNEFSFVVERGSIMEGPRKQFTYVDCLAMRQVPVLQNLAAYDFYTMSTECRSQKRQSIYRLSVPGGHPYNWNHLSGQCLSVISAFTDELAASVKNVSIVKTIPFSSRNKQPTAAERAERLLLRQYNQNVGIRNLLNESQSANQSPEKPTPNDRINKQMENYYRQIEETLCALYRTIPGLMYLFGEPDNAKSAFLLSESQKIEWLTQGIAALCSASLHEDQYGVVQLTLPRIIHVLLRLRAVLLKLINANLNAKNIDQNLTTLYGAVKRSLYCICDDFGDFMPDLCHDPEDLRVLQSFVNYHEI